jgi:hypothetical protein
MSSCVPDDISVYSRCRRFSRTAIRVVYALPTVVIYQYFKEADKKADFLPVIHTSFSFRELLYTVRTQQICSLK